MKAGKRKTGYKKEFAILLITAVFFAGCAVPQERPASNAADHMEMEKGAQTEERGAGQTPREAAGLTSPDSTFTYPEWKEEDLDTSYDSKAVLIQGNGDQVEISGKGAASSRGNVTISAAGTYVLSGSFRGQLLIDASSGDLVHLVFDNVEISCENSAAVYGKQSDKIVITLAEGSENFVSDGQVYQYDTQKEDEPNAAIFSKDDLTFNGTGMLTVSGNYEDGIRSKDDLWIVSGRYDVTTVKDSIQGKDSVWIQDGTFTINAGNDAVKASNDTEAEKGWVLIDGGEYQVHAGDDAFHAETSMIIRDGVLDIETCYEGIEGLKVELYGGDIRLYATDDGINAAGGSSDAAEDGRMGTEGNADAYIAVYGGNIHVSADGDGIDSNGSLFVYGGTVYVEGPVSDADGALDYEYDAVIEGGTVLATGSSGMAMGFGGASTQGWILYNLSEKQEADTEIVLQNKEGDTIFSARPQKEYRSIVLSVPELETQEDAVYILSCGSLVEEITLQNGVYSNGRGFGFGGKRDFEGEEPGGFPGEKPGGRPGEGSEGLPEGKPGEGLEGLPGGKTGEAPEGLPGGKPGEAPEGKPGEAPEGLPGGQSGEPPEGFPGEPPMGEPGRTNHGSSE